MTNLTRFARRRSRRLPDEVVSQLHAAERLCDDLADTGVEIRFEAPGEGRRVRAVLVDPDGNELRTVRLADVVALRLDRDAVS